MNLSQPYLLKWWTLGFKCVAPLSSFDKPQKQVRLHRKKRVAWISKCAAELWHKGEDSMLRFHQKYGSLFFPDGLLYAPADLIAAASLRLDAFRKLARAIHEYKHRPSASARIRDAMEPFWYGAPSVPRSPLDEEFVLYGPDNSCSDELARGWAGERMREWQNEGRCPWTKLAEEFALRQTSGLWTVVPSLERTGVQVVPLCLLGTLWAFELQKCFSGPLPRACGMCGAWLTTNGKVDGQRLYSHCKWCSDACRKRAKRRAMAGG